MNDKTATIQKLKDLVEKFRKERNWGKHHSSKNLAVSIAIEAAELMEHFQWDDYKEENEAELESELADIVIYCLYFAVSNKIDITKAVKKKVDKISSFLSLATTQSLFLHPTIFPNSAWLKLRQLRA